MLYALFILCLSCPGLSEDNFGQLRRVYYSRPDLNVPALDVLRHDHGTSDGYLFLSPYFLASSKPDSGPYIYDNSGDLVWTGLDASGAAGGSDVQGLHVCRYQDEDHLCFWQGQQRGMHGSGLGVIMNNRYEIVKTVSSAAAASSTDLHEFSLTADGNALITIYQPRFQGSVWLLDSGFQEIDLRNGRLVFEWNGLDHIPPSESDVPLGSFTFAGDGTNPGRAWDYFHLNSVAKTAGGDFVISARHTDCLYKISRLDGSVLWRLGGSQTAFDMTDAAFHRQHDARILSESDTRTTVSLFNNDNDGFTRHGGESRGMLIEIDHTASVARTLATFPAPVPNGVVAIGMGGMRALPNGSWLVSFGENSTVAEYTADGTPVFFAQMPGDVRGFNYRAARAPWTGRPRQPPALWTYARNEAAPMAWYVSWNGATAVRRWRFWVADARDAEYFIAGEAMKTGFETNHTAGPYRPWSFAEALGDDDYSLANSTPVRTWLPDAVVAETCGEWHCFGGHSSWDAAAGHVWNDMPRNGHRRWVVARTWLEHALAATGAVVCLWAAVRTAATAAHRNSETKYHPVEQENNENIDV